MSYILFVDDEEDIRDVCEMILTRVFPLNVHVAQSGNHALQIINERGIPKVIISDLRMPDGDGHFLYQTIIDRNWNIPFIICSTDSLPSLKKKFPKVLGHVEKPEIVTPVIELVESILAPRNDSLKYVELRISMLLRWGSTNYDLFMKLSDTHFVKVMNGGEVFIPADAERFYSKDVKQLYITASDADLYLKNFTDNMKLLIKSKSSSEDLTVVSLESLEFVERLASSLGWTSEIIEAAQHAVHLAVKAVQQDQNILKLLKKKLSDPTSIYSGHISTLALLSCGFCELLGWKSESTQMKLGMAALIHDLCLDVEIYDEVNLWNEGASDLNNKSPELVKYRSHPLEAANLLASMKNIPPDVDQIILQHHERPDGSGFPRGLNSSRISPLACVFIIVEDLVNFLGNTDDFDSQMKLFLKNKESVYQSGNFKKVFDVLKNTVMSK